MVCACVCDGWPGIELATNKGLSVSDVCLEKALLPSGAQNSLNCCFTISKCKLKLWYLDCQTSWVVWSNTVYCTHEVSQFCRCIVGKYSARLDAMRDVKETRIPGFSRWHSRSMYESQTIRARPLAIRVALPSIHQCVCDDLTSFRSPLILS